MNKLLSIICVFLLLAGCAQNSTKSRSDYRNSDPRNPASDSAEMMNVKLGVGYFQRGDTDTALAKLKKALRINPQFPMAHSAIAHVYSSMGAFADAERHYRLSVKYAPNNPEVLNNYGTFLCQQGQHHEAVKYYERTIDSPFYKTPETAHENAGVCLMKAADHDRAEKHFRSALDMNPRLLVSLYNMAVIEAGRQNHLKARAFIQRLEELTKLDEKMLNIAYQIETRLGDEEAARVYLTMLRKLNPRRQSNTTDNE